MRSRYRIVNEDIPHFITSTTVNWLPVFTSENYLNIIIESFRFSQNKKNLKLYSYVFLDNHFHAIVSGKNLEQTIASIKSFTATTIIEKLKLDKKEWLLNQLHYYMAKDKPQSNYQLWQEGFHPKMIINEEMFKQKVEYIHYNPVRRGLVLEPQHWRYSSANYYYSGKIGDLEIDSYQ